jgi:beta-lactamase regulating signal transducer with metallopeptidase domain
MNLSSYLPLFVDLMLKSAVLLGMALLAARFARSASAANRSLIWLAAFGVLLALPFTTARLPSASSHAEEAATVVVLKLPARMLTPMPAAPLAVAEAEPASDLRATAERLLGQWREALVTLWFGGAGLLLVRRMFGAVRLHLLKRRSEVVDDARIQTWAARVADNNGLARLPALRASSAFPVAITWGTWRPVVMLPAGACDWSDERIELVLRHELAHVARRDCLARLLSQVACALYWPNPLVWLASRRLRLAQEQACDDRVLTAGAEAPVYAAELLAAAQAWGDRATCGGAVSMAEPSTLERRILGVLGVARRDGARRGAMVCAWLAAGVALAGCSTVKVGESSSSVSSSTGVTVRPLAEGDPVSSLGMQIPSADRRAVEIEVKFIELNEDGAIFDAAKFFGGALTPGATTSTAVLGHLPEAARRMREISARSGVTVLSAPRVTVLNQNRATISVVQELRYPKFFESVAIDEKTEFESRNKGVETSILPNILSDGSVALEVQTMIRELEGYVSNPAQVAKAQELAAEESTVAASIFVPVFMERADNAAIVLRPGQIAVLRAADRKMALPEHAPEWARRAALVEQSKIKGHEARGPRTVLIFVSAKVLAP